MGSQTGSQRGRTVVRRVFALSMGLATTLATVGAATAGRAGAATGGPGPLTGSVHVVSPAAQRAARTFWSRSRMASAASVNEQKGTVAPDGPPPGIPSPTQFSGVPTVGALFFTSGPNQTHFCTASVVNSLTANLVLTAAHCVYGSTYASNIEFVPAYHDGQQPYGAWPVQSITVASGWKKSHDPNLDFAFLAVTPPPGTSQPIQFVTGGLWLGIDAGYDHKIEVIGYNNTGDAPIKCATTSFEFRVSQMKFFCRNYQDGTSGGPWILGYNDTTGTGVVFGVIGGYKEGGLYPWASFSAYFGLPTLKLFLQAEKRQV
jgi:V8-like Glu-specific endopeptidase